MTQTDPLVRPEEPGDVAAIHAVEAAAFGREAEARLVDMLRERGHLTLSLVAVRAGKIVGHIAFSPMSIEGASPALKVFGLGPIAVAPDLQNQGIGSALIRAGLERCRGLGADAVLLLGHMHYYPRFGFRPASDFGVGNEYGAGDAFMALPLRDGALDGIRGVARYMPEFVEYEK